MPRERVRRDASTRRDNISNRHVAGVLFELADALEVGGTDSFRVRAYRSAARVIENLGAQAAEIATEGGVKALKELISLALQLKPSLARLLSISLFHYLELSNPLLQV